MNNDTESTEGSPTAVDPKLVGIGGWLILPAIGFALGPIHWVWRLIELFARFSEVADAGYRELYTFGLLVSVGLLVFLIYAATRFFGNKSDAPSTIIRFMAASLIASGVLLAVELAVGPKAFAIGSWRQFVRAAIRAAIWIPYFRVSKRVKATFVN